MRVLWVIALFIGFAIGFSGGQQNTPSTPSSVPDTQPARVKVYTVGPGVTAPELLPLNVTGISTEDCKKKMDGKVVLSILVDETGKPRNLMLLKPSGSVLDQFALKIVEADRFNPGIHEGAPVVVAQSVEVELQSCVEGKKDDAGIEIYSLRLRSQPMQTFALLPNPPEEAVLTSGTNSWNDIDSSTLRIDHVGGSVTAPVVLSSADPQYTTEALKAKFNGVCLISLIVDQHGMPQDVRVVRALGMGLDEKAIEAVRGYRFKPAMKYGKPVPVMVTIMVNFHIF